MPSPRQLSPPAPTGCSSCPYYHAELGGRPATSASPRPHRRAKEVGRGGGTHVSLPATGRQASSWRDQRVGVWLIRSPGRPPAASDRCAAGAAAPDQRLLAAHVAVALGTDQLRYLVRHKLPRCMGEARCRISTNQSTKAGSSCEARPLGRAPLMADQLNRSHRHRPDLRIDRLLTCRKRRPISARLAAQRDARLTQGFSCSPILISPSNCLVKSIRITQTWYAPCQCMHPTPRSVFRAVCALSSCVNRCCCAHGTNYTTLRVSVR